MAGRAIVGPGARGTVARRGPGVRAARGRSGPAGLRSALLSALLPGAALAAACAAASLAPDALLLTRDGLARGEWWRLWTGHLVHLDGRHFAFDVALVGLLLAVARPWRWLGLAAPAVGAASLALRPDLASYAGLSGLGHGLALLAAAEVARAERGARRAVAAGLAAAVAAKALAETALQRPLLPGTVAETGAIVFEAHALGVGLALAACMARALGARPRPVPGR